VARNFQLDTLAAPTPRSRKRTYAYRLCSLRTLRFLLLARAGRLARSGGRHILRLSQNPPTQALHTRIEHALVAAVSMVNYVLPGTIVGIAYLLAFNDPPLVLTGTAAVIVASTPNSS